MKRATIVLIALVSAFVPVAAPAGLGLDVSPVKLDIEIPRGQSYNLPVTISNSSTDPTHVQAFMVDYSLTAGGDYRFEKVGSRKYSLMRWASVNPREFDLAPGTTEQVRLTLRMPNQADLSGEYSGIVFFQTRPTRRAGTTVAFSARVATKIYVTIPGTVTTTGEISKMTSSGGILGQQYHIYFHDTGNTHEYLHGEVQVQRNGTTIEQVPIDGAPLVERGEMRVVDVTGKRLEAGSYQAIAIIDYGGKTQTGGEITFTAK